MTCPYQPADGLTSHTAPPSDVIESWVWYHLKARMRLPINVSQKQFVYLEPFASYRAFYANRKWRHRNFGHKMTTRWRHHIPKGSGPTKGWNIRFLWCFFDFYFYFFIRFFQRPTGQHQHWDYANYGSKHVFWRKEVPLRGLNDSEPFLG